MSLSILISIPRRILYLIKSMSFIASKISHLTVITSIGKQTSNFFLHYLFHCPRVINDFALLVAGPAGPRRSVPSALCTTPARCLLLREINNNYNNTLSTDWLPKRQTISKFLFMFFRYTDEGSMRLLPYILSFKTSVQLVSDACPGGSFFSCNFEVVKGQHSPTLPHWPVSPTS